MYDVLIMYYTPIYVIIYLFIYLFLKYDWNSNHFSCSGVVSVGAKVFTKYFYPADIPVFYKVIRRPTSSLLHKNKKKNVAVAIAA